MFPVICFSPKPATSPTTTAETRNSAVSSGNHQPRFHQKSLSTVSWVIGSVVSKPMIESHGMTEKTSRAKLKVVIASTSFWRPVNVRSEASCSFSTAARSSGGSRPGSDRAGS